MSSGTSTTHILCPVSQYLATSHTISLRTAGCTMPLSNFLCPSSLNIISPSRARSIAREPSFKRTSFPKVDTICAWADVPGSTTRRARRSASTMGMPCDASRCDTVDFPEAMPPVSPTTVRECSSKRPQCLQPQNRQPLHTKHRHRIT